MAVEGAFSPGGYGALSNAGKYGIRPYNQLREALKGTGLQAHHLYERRFAEAMGQEINEMLAVALTPAEHQAFTNAWRQSIKYGEGTALATQQQVMQVARELYADYSAFLKALGL